MIQDQIPVVYEPEYKYTITGPGRVTIIIAGREDQNGHGSVNLQGIGTIYLNVTSKENGEWMHNARGWWYQNADGTYPINQWKYIIEELVLYECKWSNAYRVADNRR